MEYFNANLFSSIVAIVISIATVLNLIVVTYVAIQQYILRKQDLKYNIHKDLYNRRLKVCQETTEMLRTIVNIEKPQWPDLIEFLRKIEDDAYFLFDSEINIYIKELIDKGNKKRHLNREIERLNRANDSSKEKRRNIAIKEESELNDWFFNQFEICRNKFNKYLSYKSYLIF